MIHHVFCISNLNITYIYTNIDSILYIHKYITTILLSAYFSQSSKTASASSSDSSSCCSVPYYFTVNLVFFLFPVPAILSVSILFAVKLHCSLFELGFCFCFVFASEMLRFSFRYFLLVCARSNRGNLVFRVLRQILVFAMELCYQVFMEDSLNV